MNKVFLQFRILEALTGLYECRSYRDFTGDYYPAADYEALEAKIARLVGAAECALTALEIASRQLTEDMRLVLNGKSWGGKDIYRLKAAIKQAKGRE